VIARLEHRNIVRSTLSASTKGSPGWPCAWSPKAPSRSCSSAGPRCRARGGDPGGVAEALAHAHGRGVLHRDVKPQNVLLDADAHAYLADFGIAKIVEGSTVLTRTGMISGTPQYMAPEQARAGRWTSEPTSTRWA